MVPEARKVREEMAGQRDMRQARPAERLCYSTLLQISLQCIHTYILYSYNPGYLCSLHAAFVPAYVYIVFGSLFVVAFAHECASASCLGLGRV
jgi:hypothetical protein